MNCRFWSLAVGAIGCLCLAGCLGYRAGAVGTRDFRSVAVPMFRNLTVTPQLEAQVSNAIIKRFQQDGTLRVENRESADVVLLGTITRYRRTAIRSARLDSGVPREYRLVITAQVEVRDQRTGQVILKPTSFEGAAESFIGSDLQSADYQALPLIADDIARQVVARLVESW
jgi:hypothetical protein